MFKIELFFVFCTIITCMRPSFHSFGNKKNVQVAYYIAACFSMSTGCVTFLSHWALNVLDLCHTEPWMRYIYEPWMCYIYMSHLKIK